MGELWPNKAHHINVSRRSLAVLIVWSQHRRVPVSLCVLQTPRHDALSKSTARQSRCCGICGSLRSYAILRHRCHSGHSQSQGDIDQCIVISAGR